MSEFDITPTERKLIGRYVPLHKELLERWRGFLSGDDPDGVRVREVLPAALLDLDMCCDICANELYVADGSSIMKTLQELAAVGLVTVFFQLDREAERARLYAKARLYANDETPT